MSYCGSWLLSGGVARRRRRSERYRHGWKAAPRAERAATPQKRLRPPTNGGRSSADTRTGGIERASLTPEVRPTAKSEIEIPTAATSDHTNVPPQRRTPTPTPKANADPYANSRSRHPNQLQSRHQNRLRRKTNSRKPTPKPSAKPKKKKADAEEETEETTKKKKALAKAALAKKKRATKRGAHRNRSRKRRPRACGEEKQGAGEGGSGGKGSGAGGASEFGWYGNMLHDRFYSEWVQPTSGRAAARRFPSLLRIRIEKDGPHFRILDCEIIRQSGGG